MTDQTVEICREAPDLPNRCGICEQGFSRPSTLSQHLNTHGIEWKVYWDIYLHHVSGLTCNLCSVHHTDVYSLECHLKVAHCIKNVAPPSYDAPDSAGVRQGSNTLSTSSRGAADVIESVGSNNSEPNCPMLPIEAGRKTQNTEPMQEVIALCGASAGRGRALTVLRRGRRTVMVGRARHSEPQSATTRTDYLRGLATGTRGARTLNVVSVVQNSCPAMLLDREPGVDAHSGTSTRGSGSNITAVSRGPGSRRNAQPRSVPKSDAEGAEDSDEVTEVGRVVTVALDGASSVRSGGGPSAASSSSSPRRFRRGRKAMNRRARTLDIFEVLDVDDTIPGVTDHVSGAGSSPQLPAGRPLPLYHNAAMTSMSRSQKPTAVVSPYESGREKLQQPTDPSVESVSSSSTGEVKVIVIDAEERSDVPPRRRFTPPARTQRLVTPAGPQPLATLSAGAPGPHEPRMDDSATNATHPCLHQPAETLLPLTPPPGPVPPSTITPAEAQRVPGEPTAAPPVDVRRPRPAPSAAAPVSAPVTDGIAAKSALPGWLNSVYRPGTLSRLSEQVMALSQRPGSPSQLRRLVDRSQRLKVDGQAVLASDTGGSTVQPVRRLLAAAESDHLAAGSSRDCPPDTVPGPAARSEPDEQQSPPKVELATTGLRPPSGRPPRALPGANLQTIATQADNGRNDAALIDHNKRTDVLGVDKLAGASHSGRRSDENTLPARTLGTTLKAEPRTQVKAGGVTKMCDADTFSTMDSAVKEESVAFHHPVGIDVHRGVELQSLHDSADMDLEVGSPTGVRAKPTAAVAEVKTKIAMADSANGEPMSLDDGGGSLTADPFDLPAVACDDDPLAISGDLKPTAVGSVFGGLPPRVPMVSTGERLDLLPPLTTPLAPMAARDRRQSEHPTSAGGVAATTAMAADGRPDTPVGTDGLSSARQDAGGRRRRKRKREKKKKGRRPLYSKPEGTGDGEIDPGNMVEVLFLNDDNGQEDYDAMDAMVLKVDTEVRPTRYYVHFEDTSHRHDRWVTRPDISRVYRSQLQPMQTIESPPSATPASGDPTGEEQQSGDVGRAAADEPAAAGTLCVQRPSCSSSAGIPSRGPPIRRLAFVPDVDKSIATKPAAPLVSGCLVQVVFEVTADGARLICPAKILRVNTELSYHRYLVRYLGWQRRYCEWVTESVLLRPQSSLQRNVSGQILLRCVLSPPSCPAAARRAYSSLRPCSVDLAAGNIFFLAARPLSRLINDARIAAMVTALRPRLADSLGSRTARC